MKSHHTTYVCYFAYFQDNNDVSKPIQTVTRWDSQISTDKVTPSYGVYLRPKFNNYTAWIDCMFKVINEIVEDVQKKIQANEESTFTIRFVTHSKLTPNQTKSLKTMLAIAKQYRTFPDDEPTVRAIRGVVRKKAGTSYEDPTFEPKANLMVCLFKLQSHLRLDYEHTMLSTSTQTNASSVFNALFQIAKGNDEVGL